MQPIQKIGEELIQAQKSLREHIAIPADQRGEQYAAKRDSLMEVVNGLKADYTAAQLADVPEDNQGSKAKLRAEVENANNRPERKANNVDRIGLKAAHEVLKACSTHEVMEFDSIDAKALIQARGLKAISRTDMDLAVGYDELYIKPTRPAQILDFLPMFSTGQVALTYRRRLTPITGAVNRAEGNTLGKVTATGTQVTDPIEVIGSYADFTIEEREDDAAFAALIAAMADDVREVLDGQVMVGNGTSPNLRGITTTLSPQTQAYDTSLLQTTLQAKTQLRLAERARPGLYVFNPADWDDIQIAMLASPSFAITYVQDGIVPRLHGVNVVEHEDLTAGEGGIMDPSLYALGMRQGLTVENTDSDGTKFSDLSVTYRAYVRAALKTLRLGYRKIDLTA